MATKSTEEYLLAQKRGQKEVAELAAAGKPTAPRVLDEILPNAAALSTMDLGTMEIPANRIVGTKSAGRISAFTPTFRPLLDLGSEFGAKWVRLCDAHLGDTGITDPIQCFEYMGEFYVQEGNKRVSVLRHFGAPRIPAHVCRVMPAADDSQEGRVYSEFLAFYRLTKLYLIRFRSQGQYASLLSLLGCRPDHVWTEEERRTFGAYYQYFLDALEGIDLAGADVLPEEAFLLWLKVFSYSRLGTMSTNELKKSVQALRSDLIAGDSVKVQTSVDAEAKGKLLDKLFSSADNGLRIAFVHHGTPGTSEWVLAHDNGCKHIQQVFDSRIQVRSYYDADTGEKAETAIDAAVADGAQVVFVTASTHYTQTLRAAVKYPKVEFFNCSVVQRHSSVRSYYVRFYEAKFITGAIAGAMAENNRIGYIASSPIYGEPASINAFALGAQLTNPRAKVELRWSATEGSHASELFDRGIHIFSNRDMPTRPNVFMDFFKYGTYYMDNNGEMTPLGSAVWYWGKFYEYIVRSLFNGSYRYDKDDKTALNYWLGLDSGVIDVKFFNRLPEGVRTLAELLRKGIVDGRIDPFARRIVAQDGSVKNDGTHTFTSEERLHMDWLCENVIGTIPTIDECLPEAKPMVRQMGIFPEEKSAGDLLGGA